ncbi:hypothetical protein MKZ38_007824 [Zalerion maritima]|uniref:Uncharacterized protein n=1 Tax=Zalerion maritima TaxID=339359 RepID=A0AAD5WMS7_9PEZI|nr:hypothetical protein MKZ38_007824 [Zalerion maritima]
MDETQTSPQAQKEQIVPAATSRKRQLDSDDDAEPQTKRARTTRPTSEPARLTRKNLATLDKMGKKKTSDPTDDSGSTRTKTTSTISSGFNVQARKNGILDPYSSKPPKNLENIRERHVESRATASPPQLAYDDYVDKVDRIDRSGNEATMVVDTSRRLLKDYDDRGYNHNYNRAFTNLPKDVGFNNGLSAPQPDFIEGLEMEKYLPFPVDDRIPGAALYKDDRYSITLPQIAGEWKGPAGDIREAKMQSAYNGAAMVHARTQALAYMGKEDPPGYAEITTFTTNGINLNLYAHYATPSAENKNTLEYHQYSILTTNIKDTYQGHKDGRKGLRNAQDHARNQSYALKDDLREHWKQTQQHRNTLHPIAEGVPTLPVPGTELLNAYENEDDYEVVEHQPVHQPTPPTSSKHKSSNTHSHHSQYSHHSHSTPHSPKAHSAKSSHSHHSESQKRKAPSSQSSHGSSAPASKHRSYWKKDRETGQYYHVHSDGTVSWLDDEGDERD